MKRAALFLALALAAGSSQARNLDCDVSSRYDVSFNAGRIDFTSEDGADHRVRLAAGVLYIDGQPAALGAADRARLLQFAGEVQALAPEVQSVALEAVEIAFLALSDVARALSEDGDKTVAKLADARREVERELRATPAAALNGDVIGDAVGTAVAELVPALVGDIVQAALAAAFSGDTRRAEALESRANKLEREIERRIEPRAEALGLRAQALCDRFAALDRLEAKFDYRLPNGERLDLLRSGSD
ncbi:DUF2884 family protein [Arenimonas sp. MALMAid1274]|uniref:DUF2884 family protein n=1 Tax=Arenimonas sp. MALMAid1274 TaxID=3411630 RepID=UPI003BA018F7